MEKITLQCSLCNKTIDTTHDEFMRRGYTCWLCKHGELNIIWGEYSELALIIHRAAKELEKIPPGDAARLAQPIADLLEYIKAAKAANV